MAAPIPDDADDPTKEDFYSLLNISKEVMKSKRISYSTFFKLWL